MAKAEELVRTIAENGPLAVRAIKETVEKCSGLPFEAAFKIENEAQRFIRAQPRWSDPYYWAGFTVIGER